MSKQKPTARITNAGPHNVQGPQEPTGAWIWTSMHETGDNEPDDEVKGMITEGVNRAAHAHGWRFGFYTGMVTGAALAFTAGFAAFVIWWMST